MRRRTLLRLTGLSLTTTLAGCNSDSIEDTKRTPADTETATGAATSETETIERVVRALWTAYNEEDAGGVVDTFHPDSPQNVSADSITFQGTVTIESITVTDSTEEMATAEATVTVTDGSRTMTENHRYELRRHDGAWAIWSYSAGEDGSTPTDTD